MQDDKFNKKINDFIKTLRCECGDWILTPDKDPWTLRMIVQGTITCATCYKENKIPCYRP